jgi:hypothetical protein
LGFNVLIDDDFEEQFPKNEYSNINFQLYDKIGCGWITNLVSIYKRRNLNIAANLALYFIWNGGGTPLIDERRELFSEYYDDAIKYYNNYILLK